MNLKGRTVILTEARRIGQVVAVELVKKGANLAITYRSSKEESEAVCNTCSQEGIRSKAFQADLTKSEDIKGKIITISDWSVLRSPYKNYLPYNSAKSAVVGLTLSLAKELAPFVTVNNIAPGPTIRPSELTEEENKEVMSRTPLGRWGGGEEIAKAVLYLLDADFVTGIVLPVDGGRSIA